MRWIPDALARGVSAIERVYLEASNMDIREVQLLVGVRATGAWDASTCAAVARGLRSASSRPRLLRARIGRYFVLEEFTRSDTARARGLLNMPNAAQLAALVVLVDKVLDPVRERFGPVRVTSGYREFTPASQHGAGEAADFEVTGVPNLTVARWIRDNLPFDQLILEAWSPGAANAGWIHASYRVGRLRKSVLRTPTGRAPYFTGLPA